MQAKNIEDVYPLSGIQEGMLFHSVSAPGSGVYVQQLSCVLEGKLDRGAFRGAWGEVVAGHEVMRTAFVWKRVEEPLQVVHGRVELPWEEEDWRGKSEEEQREELIQVLEQDARRGFDVSVAPLMRMRLMRLGEDRHQFIWTHHHLLMDGWSLPIVMQELQSCYEQMCGGRGEKRRPGRRYREYVEWVRRQDWSASEKYWRELLKGFQEPTRMGVDRAAGGAGRGEPKDYAVVERRIGAAKGRAIRELARESRVTLSTVIQGAWGYLLSRYSGETDVVFGVTVSGRPAALAGVETMVGVFINTLPMRVVVNEQEEEGRWLARLQSQQVEGRQYEWTPLARVQGWSEVARGVGLFESIVVFENYPVERIAGAKARLKIEQAGVAERTNYPLTIVVVPEEDSIVVRFNYDVRRLEGAAIARMGEHLETVLEAMSGGGAEQKVGALRWIGEPERRQIVEEWNRTAVAYEQTECLHEMVEEQVERTGDAIAVVSEQEQVSYEELNRRANGLARRLRKQGVGADTVVGVCLERSVELVVALLGVLKAGGAYVPLDAGWPEQRLSYVMEETQARVVITDEQRKEVVAGSAIAMAVYGSEGGSGNPAKVAAAENLAYVMYTSGSTGKPKGVMIPHRGICNRLQWMQQAYEITEKDRVLQKTPYGFDVSVWEFFWPLMTGACLVMAHPGGHREPAYLSEVIREQEITALHFVPSMLEAFLAATGEETYPSLRYVMCSGEALPPEQQQRCLSRLEVDLENLYGPTEASVDVTYWRCGAGPHPGVVPIGRPIANTQIYVKRDRETAVPVGVAGELYIGGVGLARGYLRQPAQTAEMFVPDECGTTAGGRLYRTGDRARYLSDGAVEYLGRRDAQVKIRGVRIELAEVEMALARHPAVREVVVVAKEEEGGGKRLVVYIVGEQAASVSTQQWRSFAQTVLPDAMIPAAYVVLDRLPLTANGKLDRRALPSAAALTAQQDYVAPSTPIETTLAAIWTEILGLAHVGIHDNFFDLGGDSIRSIQIVAKAAQQGLHLTPKQLFDHQTISALAAVAQPVRGITEDQRLIAGEVPLTPIQHWFFDRRLAEPHHWNQAVLLLVPGRLDRSMIVQAVERLLAHHDALRLRFALRENRWIQTHGTVDPNSVVRSIEISPGRDGEKQRYEAMSEAQTSLDLGVGPLTRVVLMHDAVEESTRLFIVIHHLAVDGVSWRILLQDLQTAYEQVRDAKEVKLPPKTCSFKKWAECLREYVGSSALRDEIAYWEEQTRMRGADLPIDYVTGENREGAAATVSVMLSEEETDALLHKVPRAHRTRIHEVLLTALLKTLRDWSGKSSWLIDLEGHGREEIGASADLSRTVGWLTSLFPVHLDYSEGVDLGAALHTVKKQLRSIPNNGIGYGVLRYLSTPDIQAKLSEARRAQIGFNYLGDFDQVLTQSSGFRMIEEFVGPLRSPLGFRDHLLDVDVLIAGRKLRMNWTYCVDIHDHQTVASLADRCIKTIRSVIENDFAVERAPSCVDGLLARFEDVYPLSGIQEGMLFHSVSAPGSGVYVQQLSCVLEGKLDRGAFRGAWGEVVAGHEVMRTAFVWKRVEEPLQVVHGRVELPWEEEDWRGKSEEEQREELIQVLEQDARRGFDVSVAPLMRMRLMRLGEDRHQFIWTHHHLLMDGWSLPIVMQELQSCYEQMCGGRGEKRRPGRRYREYVEWVRRQDWSASEKYWRELLKGFQEPTRMGVDRAAGGAGRGEPKDYAVVERRIGAAKGRAIRELARESRVTLSTVIQGAWGYLLSRYSGETDVVFGVTVSGRPAALAGVETMVGVFINTLPMRVVVNEQEEEGRWLARLQSQQVEGRQYEWTPLARVQGWSEVARGVGLFESIVVFENYPVERIAGAKARLKIEQAGVAERTNYPLTIVVVPEEDSIVVRFNYDVRRLEGAAIARMGEHLETVLEAMSGGGAEQKVGALRWIGEPERRQIVEEWNRTAVAYEQTECLHEMVEEQVERTGDAIAVVSEQEQVSYEELNRRANGLARRLRKQGVGADTVVGVCLERSVELVVALLGVLKAGGAYVPLDAGWPEQRLSYVMEETQARVVITDEQRKEVVAGSAIAMAVYGSEGGSGNPAKVAAAENLAYVMYTSGSTGKPKGVMIPHRGICNRLQWMQQAYEITEKDRVLQKTPYGFDVSVWEFFWPLMTGACLVMAHPGGHREPAYLSEVIREQEITALHFVPSMLEAFLAATGEETYPSLRYVMCSGEALPPEQQQRCLSRLEVDLENLYGPTEASVDVTYWRCGAGPHPGVVPIGRPIANTQIYVKRDRETAVPVGVAGELYIGGVGLARGYLRQPAQTAEMFVPDECGTTAGGRLYRTGDRARYLSDGAVEYLGRRDAQVKIRGVRIELAEVEMALARHPAVREVVVVAKEEEGGGKRLVVYIVGEQAASVSTQQWRSFAQTVLPDAMIPAAYVVLDRLPLTANGKLDRRALPSAAALTAQQDYVAPSTPIETTLAAIWTEILGLAHVGIHDNFFDLGGDSIMATRIVSRVNSAMNVDLPLEKLLLLPNIAQLASYISQLHPEERRTSAEMSETIASGNARELLAALDDMSEDQLDSVLNGFSSSAT